MGKKVIYCGAAGQGSMMKMFINLLLGVMMEGFAEALNFGRLGAWTWRPCWKPPSPGP